MTAILEAPEHTGPHRLLDPLPRVRRRVRSGTILVWSLIAVVLTVQGWNIAGYPGLGDDEGTYLSQAWAVRTGYGLAPYTYWYDHPPGGWLQIALLSWLPDWIGGQPVTAYGRWIMLVVSAVNVALLYGLARRVGMARWSCALAVLMFGLSPLSVTMQRQIYLDSFAVAWFLGAFFLALSPRRHLWHHVAAGACAGVSVLSKETMAVALPALVVALWHGSHPSTRRFSLAGFLSSLVLVISFYPLYALIKLEFLPGADHVSLIGAIQFQLQSRTGSGTVFEAGSDASKLLNAWLYSDHILLVSGVAATLLALLFSGTRRLRRLRPIVVAAVLLVMVGVRPGGYLPAMYVLQILPFLALIIAALAEQAVRLITVPRLFSYRTETVLRWSLVAALAAAAAWTVVPPWYAGNRHAMTTDDNQPYRAAAFYIRHQIPDPAGKRIVVDNALWLDAVEAGFTPGTGAVWFYKLDKDADVSSVIRSYRDVDYVVSSPIMRQSAEELPTAKAALEHSQVLRTFGSGDNRVEIREIVR